MATAPLIELDPSWPRLDLAQAQEILCAPGQRFEMETVDIRGVPTRVWKNAPPSLAALIQLSRAHGARPFTIYEDERVTYDANYRAVAHLAARLREMGVGKGDRVGLAMRNLPEWPVIFFAATSIGAIIVPLNAWWTGAELEYGIADSGAKILFLDGGRHGRLAEHYRNMAQLERVFVSRTDAKLEGRFGHFEDLIGGAKTWADLPEIAFPQVRIAPDDDATIFYTSGTTGHPKGALGTHRNIITNIFSGGYAAARSFLRRGEQPPEPEPRTSLLVIPLFHVTACSAGMMTTIASGSAMVFMYKWDPVAAMEIIEREKVAVTGGVPTIAWQLLEHPDRDRYDLSSLENIAYGGAPAAPELVRRIYTEFGALPGNGWGMTETMATVTSHGAEDYLNRPTSCGPPVPVADLKIMSPEGDRELPVGEVGELWVKGPMVVKGYWEKPGDTAEAFVDGWVKTGDLARLDEEGFCYIVDRAKDIIIRGGENIYSSEVEDVLYSHPAVTDAALIGVPHRTLGEEPVAVVHLAPGTTASEAELQDLVRERLAAFKVPVAVRFSDAVLPRNANGKIMKRELKAWFAAEQAA
ncbi:class I adenylate-forming enzyme family protein [Stakelama saccharophila]|uniref:Class I adenylate-forming enzyme family protein n=1 Tax=Stakelama saccharophila TaxID=3075605 RepID=A0ABZ0BCG1_9SPHN|nr:class I adenylate-forming enzyme family protein [Stakelama sp. W311]WNO54987.1 class I adenylate-forming enzyme family protein [Stakelama sp. W311]